MCFANAFRSNEITQTNRDSSSLSSDAGVQYYSTPGAEENFEFEVFLEIKVYFISCVN